MIENEEVFDFLSHFGVKGMQWGVRKDRAPGVSSRTDREARKDAKEHSRAKMFYGEGAGNRRKLIKATVEAKAKRDPNYKKAFDHHVNRQDMSTHASKARSERSKVDRRTKNKQRAGFFARKFTGEMGTQAAFAAVAVGGAAFINSPRGRAMASRSMKTVKNFASQPANRARVRRIEDFLKSNG